MARHPFFVRPALRLTLGAMLLSAVRSNAETVGYWRFEEKTSGNVSATNTGGAVPNTILDSSGKGNHMQTWTATTAPIYTASVPFPNGTLAGVPATGAINTASLDFRGSPVDIYTGSKPINSKTFTAWTVEASFCLDVAGRWQVIVGKDGNPINGQPPLTLKVRADNTVEIGIVDGSGVGRWCVSSTKIEAGKWYQAAATATGSELSLWIKPAGYRDYLFQGSAPIQGAFFNTYTAFNQPWIIGRGMWKGVMTDVTDGKIDEVRISDTALTPDQFLGNYSVADSDADGLPDTWELVHFRANATETNTEIIAKQSSLTADLDGDGYTNRVELRSGTSPAVADNLTGKLTRQVWLKIPGDLITDLANNSRFYGKADITTLNDGASTPRDIAENFGERLQGWLTAPVTGDYTFWVAGDNQCELWLSTDASKFHKQRVASVLVWTAPEEWEKYPAQKSAVIHLVAGQKYFIECLHKEATIYDSLSVAWQAPGEARQVIPAQQFTPYLDDAEDQDLDGLPDAWEIQYGLNTSDDGSSDAAQSPIADPDRDGFTNIEESELGMNPLLPGGVPGHLSLETWFNLPGTSLEELKWSPRFCGIPDASELISLAETVRNRVDNYGARMRGYVTAPITGDYTFYLSGDDSCELWLSPSASQFAKQKIAWFRGWTNPREWTKFPTQKSNTISLVAGQKYYLEALQKEGAYADSFAIGWQTPGTNSIDVIPGSVLDGYALDLDDQDGDNMADSWEVQHGLNPQVNDAALDPDLDLIVNGMEFANGSDPQTANSAPGALVDECWWDIPGDKVKDLTNSPKMLATPNRRRIFHFTETDPSVRDGFGRRVRGYITAPITGDYTFWIASDDASELWLSTGESKFNRKKIACVQDYVAIHEWDLYPSQKSGRIHLIAGQRYYFDALHKDRVGRDHLSIAWQLPGGVREVIPGYALSTFVRTMDDLDDDYLLDSWEVANGLEPADNGSVLSKNGANGDLDNDGLSNLAEMQAGTRADIGDTDGDGVSDRDEVEILESQALIADAAPFEPVLNLDGAAFSANHGDWFIKENSAVQGTTRGWVEYDLGLTSPGVYQATISFFPEILGASYDALDLIVDLDGQRLGRISLTVTEGREETIKVLTPWLPSGAHKLRVFVDNAVTSRRLAVRHVEIAAARGNDTDGNGRPDWVDLRTVRTNALDPVSESFTSPVCLEGKTRWPGLSMVGGAAVERAPNGRWFANVPLDPQEQTIVQTSMENGALQAIAEIQWKTLNALTTNDITIRVGDSLKLSAFAGIEPTSLETVTLNINGQTSTFFADEPLIHSFTSSGNVPIQVSHELNGVVSISTLNVHVLGIPSIESPICVAGQFRDWDVASLPEGAVLELEAGVEREALSLGSNRFRHVIGWADADDRIALLRSADNGPILSSIKLRGMRVRAGSETSVTIEETSEGLMKVGMPIVVNGLWADATVRIEIFIGGVIFDDGTIVKELHPSLDCNEDGVVKVTFLKAGNVGATCHRISIWQNGQRIGWKQ